MPSPDAIKLQQAILEVTRAHKKTAERAVQRSLDEWCVVYGVRLAAKVHGSEPIGGRYPAEGLTVSFSVHPDFPNDVPDDIPGDPRAALRPHIALLDLRLREWLGAAGMDNLRPYWDEDGDGFSLAHHFPPILGTEGEEILRCFRPVAEGDPTSGSPFSDEQWVAIKYAGINCFRVINWRPSTDLKAVRA